jgi:glycosyltransferase involved in cell wall biosynthesis
MADHRPTIEAIVDAIRAGPVKDVEIIIVDDCSTDGTRELLAAKTERANDARCVLGRRLAPSCESFVDNLCSAAVLPI